MPATPVSGPCVGGRVPVNYAQQSLGGPLRAGRTGETHVTATSGGPEGSATQTIGDRLGLSNGMVVQELGWDEDVDDDLRVAIEDAIDADLVDGDYGNVVEAVRPVVA